MHYFIVLLLVLFVIFLFTLFVFCRDDFILFRKNVDMEKIFNLTFLVILIGLFFSRFLYVLLYFNPMYLHPLAFLLFPYFPGLSLAGGLLGGSFALMFLSRSKKYPEGRVFDLFMFAFIITLCIAEVAMFGISYGTTKRISLPFLAHAIVLFLIFLLSLRVFKNHSLKEGSVGLAIVVFLSMVYIGAAIAQKTGDMYKEVGSWILVTLFAIVFFLRQERVTAFFKFFGKK